MNKLSEWVSWPRPERDNRWICRFQLFLSFSGGLINLRLYLFQNNDQVLRLSKEQIVQDVVLKVELIKQRLFVGFKAEDVWWTPHECFLLFFQSARSKVDTNIYEMINETLYVCDVCTDSSWPPAAEQISLALWIAGFVFTVKTPAASVLLFQTWPDVSQQRFSTFERASCSPVTLLSSVA